MLARRILGVLLLCLLPTLVLSAELKLRPPPKPFDSYPVPQVPDYATAGSWAVWPGRASPADQIPPGIDGKLAKNPKADVFFIHPTTFLNNSSWNAKYDEDDFTGKQLEQAVLRYQTSAFNGCCRMYVPRYRQATLSAFLNPGNDANKAFGLAYSDVLRAFDYYIDHENNGRPFILASHSQGSLHATRLLKERILTRPELRKRLVVAYIVGAAMPDAIAYSGLPVCDSAHQTGCMIDWNSATSLTVLALGRRQMVTYSNGKYERLGNKTWLCVNPLSWDRKTVSPPSANKGALPIVDLGEPLPHVVQGITGARCERGRLIIKIPLLQRKGFKDPLTIFGSYHNQDYSLFYASIRQNAIDRVQAFTGK
jgi:hypothetical protein